MVDHFQENAFAIVGVFQFRKTANINIIYFFLVIVVAVLKGIRTATFGEKAYPSCAMLQGSDSTLWGSVSEVEYL